MTVVMVGIDPGAHTGYAEWDMAHRTLRCVATLKIHEAMARVTALHDSRFLHSVTFEDARLRTWFGRAGREKLQGAGAIKRECTIWSEFLGDMGLAYHGVKPAAGSTKWPADVFAARTGYAGRTSEHGRDAALLVFGRTQ